MAPPARTTTLALTRLLLDAGANPNDNESLYHSRETRDLTIARMLLDAGAVVEGTNALLRQLDFDDMEGLRLMLAHTRDVNDTSRGNETALLHSLRRRRSPEHVRALLDTGADPHARAKDGTTAYRLALQFGLTEAAAMLSAAGAAESLSLEDQFLAACARGDAAEARRFVEAQPGIIRGLSEHKLQLPELAAARNGAAVRGDGGPRVADRSAGRRLGRVRLEPGGLQRRRRADPLSARTWCELDGAHGFGDNVHGTLSFASRNHEASEGDWVGCAQALVEHGLPVEQLDGDYSDEVTDVFRRAGGTDLAAGRRLIWTGNGSLWEPGRVECRADSRKTSPPFSRADRAILAEQVVRQLTPRVTPPCL